MSDQMKRCARSWAVLTAALLLPACNFLQEFSTPEVKAFLPVTPGEFRTIAVLPVKNMTDREDAGAMVRNALFLALAAKGYTEIRPEDVEQRLTMAGLGPFDLEAVDPRKLAKMVKADGLVYGVVTHCTRLFLGLYSQSAVGAEVRIVDACTGATVFQAQHVERTHAGALVLSLFDLPENIITSCLNMRDRILLQTADHLAKKLVERFPQNIAADIAKGAVVTIKAVGDFKEVAYIVQPGDTLYGIAGKFYGDGSQWKRLVEANKGLHERSLAPNMVLAVPRVPVVEDPAEAALVDARVFRRVVYRVKWRDSLYSLAQRAYGDGNKWRIIREANAKEIEDVKDLPVGQVLIIPILADSPPPSTATTLSKS